MRLTEVLERTGTAKSTNVESSTRRAALSDAATSPLRDVAECRIPIAKVFDFCLAETIESVIPLAQIALSVLPFAVCDTGKSKNKDSALPGEVDGVSGGVFRFFIVCICPEVRLAEWYGGKEGTPACGLTM